MKLIVFNTETATLPENTHKSVLAEIDYVFYDSQKNFFFGEGELIKPEVRMSPSSSAVNGISDIDVGLEPDVNGKVRDVPTPDKSEVFKRFLGGIKKYSKSEDFYVCSFNFEKFEKKVVERAAGGEVFKDVPVIDLYKIVKYVYFTDEGRKRVDLSKFYVPENLSLKLLKYHFKTYKNDERIKERINVSNVTKGFEDAIDVLSILKFVKDEFSFSMKEMCEITKRELLLDYFPYGRLKGRKIKETDTKTLLGILNGTKDEELAKSILKEILKNRKGYPQKAAKEILKRKKEKENFTVDFK